MPLDVVVGCTEEHAAKKAAKKAEEAEIQLALQKQNRPDRYTENEFVTPANLLSRPSTPLGPVEETPTDATPLLPLVRRPSIESTGSANSANIGIRRESSWSNLSKTVFKVRSYVGLANDKEILLKMFQDADEKLDQFVKTYDGEVQKVKMFYEDKLAELSEHIEAIIESVDTSHLKVVPPKKSRKSSLIDRLVVQFEKTHLKKTSEFDIPTIRTSAVFGDSSDDLMDIDSSGSPLKRTRSKNPELLDLERESDSIKRALTDVYREAKMLHNYAIMVSLLMTFGLEFKMLLNSFILCRIIPVSSRLVRSLTRHYQLTRECSRTINAMMGRRLKFSQLRL